MGQPLVSPRNWMKPAYHRFQQGQCAPEWRWFWQLAVLADPLWGVVRDPCGFDYAAWCKPSVIEPGGGAAIGPRGMRWHWNTGDGIGDDYAYNSSGTGAISPSLRPQWSQNGDISMFAMLQPTTLTNDDLLLGWEGGDGETAAENSTMFIDYQANGSARYIHESGSGTNTVDDLPNGNITTTRFSLAVTRDIVAKEIKWYKAGTLIRTGTYATNPSTSTLQVSLGDRIGSDTGFPSDQYIEAMYLFKATLSPAMVVQLDRDPWGPFRPPHRSSAGGGGGAGTGVRSFVAGVIG
jgi:hypothetical protein